MPAPTIALPLEPTCVPSSLESMEEQLAMENIVSLSSSEERDRRVFMQDLNKFMAELGKPLSKIPIMGYKELDLFQLFKEVTAYGGFNEVVKNVGTWSKIWKRLGNFDPSITDSSFRLKKNYERYLLEYEYKNFPEHRQQALEFERQQQLKKSGSLENLAGSSSGSPPSSPVLQQHLPLSPRFKPEKKAKKPKKKATATLKDVVRDKMGAVRLPQTFSEITLENLGAIIARPPYVTEKHLYPIGFTSSRYFTSMINGDEKVKYTSQILDGGDRPQFVVTAADDPTNPIISYSPSGAWRAVLKRVGAKGDESPKNFSVSGALRFGLSHPIISQLIKELPNAVRSQASPANEQERSSQPSSPSTKKRKCTDSDYSSSEESDSSDDLSWDLPQIKAPKYANDYVEQEYFSARNTFFATREEMDDLESAVATLHALKHCAVY